MDSLALELGVTFKESKDVGTVHPTSSLEFLGIMLDLSTSPITAGPSADKLD
jgi:hypothetical protein